MVLLLAAVAYTILQKVILLHHGPESKLAKAVGGDGKGKLSLALYISAVPLAFVNQWLSDALYVTVALIWFLPDPRLEAQPRH